MVLTPVLDDLLTVVGADRNDSPTHPHASAVEQECWSTTADGLRAAPPRSWCARWPTAGRRRRARARSSPAVVDRASAELATRWSPSSAPRASSAGDHFAPPGANDRVWNALEKLARAAPAVFVDYYASDVLARVAHAWLGPATRSPRRSTSCTPAARRRSGTADYHLGVPARPR
jgi:hypothetical protein